MIRAAPRLLMAAAPPRRFLYELLDASGQRVFVGKGEADEAAAAAVAQAKGWLRDGDALRTVRDLADGEDVLAAKEAILADSLAEGKPLRSVQAGVAAGRTPFLYEVVDADGARSYVGAATDLADAEALVMRLGFLSPGGTVRKVRDVPFGTKGAGVEP